MLTKCKLCGNSFKPRAVGTKTEKRFCNTICRKRYNSKDRYNKLKDSKSFKEKRKIYFKKWLNKNREHFNDLVREPNKINRRKKYYEFKKLGVCTSCGRKKERDITLCNKCAEQNNKRSKKRYAEKNK